MPSDANPDCALAPRALWCGATNLAPQQARVMADAHTVANPAQVEYRDIDGFPGYRVGSDGSVWSRWAQRRRPGQRRGFEHVPAADWRRLKAIRQNTGYCTVGLSAGGKQRIVSVHRLVLTAFVGPCPPGMETRHLDGDRTNNHIGNLSWGTKKENGADRVRHGTAVRGERYPRAVLTEAVVREVRRRLAAGARQRDVADDMGVSRCQVSHIHTRRAWAWVT
jgi:hypothetical protein